MKTLQMVLCFFFGLRIMCALYELYIPIDNYSEYIQALTIVEESIMSMIIFMLLYLLRAQPYSQAYDEINIELIQLLIKMLNLTRNLEPFMSTCIINFDKLNAKDCIGSHLIKKCGRTKTPVIIVNPEDDINQIHSNNAIMSRLSIGHYVNTSRKSKNRVS